ncbi:TPR repeat-containing protein DDB_G0287407-like isoform X2 [Babylonia areolata]|uniref:TPR repeat-containing protein DDB_G0287407-like isoform X2 n=1 Tax=Babylonia areolata TaxID=304850 RepID=UPI003FD56F6B
MEEEREELTRKYFPQIHHACNAKGIQFVAVDMRWGITSQAAENAQVINICLREIDRSDIFVGFFGQRYGWHGSDDKQLQENFDNAVGKYSWLDAVRDRSVTELEFLHGYLNNPGALPACICFRDKVYDDAQREEGLSKGDKKQVFKYTSESEHATAMMDDLKERVKVTESKCLGVNMQYPDPHEGARFMFESIWPYLTEVLLADTVQLSKREQQREEHDAFRAHHITIYEGGQTYLDFLNSKLADGQGSVLIEGPAGSGKSALLSNWTHHLEMSRPEVVLLYHFVGCAPGTTADSDILSRLLAEVNHALHKQADRKRPADSEDGEDVQQLQQLLLRAIEDVVTREQKKVVIVLDGLDRCPKVGKTTKHLFWLPSTWPAGVLFVASTVDTDTATFDLLVTERQYEVLTVKPLNETTKKEICVRVLKKSGKELSADQLDRVVAAPHTSNPLYLRLVLAELSIFGYFRLLDKKIDSLIYSADVGELLQKMFTRLEEDYNGRETGTRRVQEVLCAIDLSKHGLLEKELMEMLRIESQDWLTLYFAMEGLLISHAGLLRFAFAEISHAVKAKYLQDEEEKNRMLKLLTGYFDNKLQAIPIWESLPTPLSKRPVEELPWLQLATGDLEGLTNTLLNIFTLTYMQKQSEYEFFELWKATGKKMSEICDRYLQVFDLAVADLYLYQQDLSEENRTPPGYKLRHLLSSMGQLFNMAGFPQGAVKMHQRDIDVLMHIKGTISSVERFRNMMETCYIMSCALVDCGRYKEGEESHRQIMESCQEYLKEHPEDEVIQDTVGMICHGIGVACVKQKLWDQMYEEMFFGHLPLDVGNLLTNIGLCHRHLGNLDEAETNYMRSLEVKANAVGWDHDVVALAYLNLSSLNLHRDDFTKAEHYIRKAIEILEGNGATLDKTEYRNATENLICCLLSLSKVEEALPIYLPLFRKQVEVDDMDHCIPSVHREMAKYVLHIGDPDTAREITVALINSRNRHQQNYIMLDHLQSMLPESPRPKLPLHCTLEHALQEIWPGDPDLTRRIIEHHALPAGDIDRILKVQAVCAEKNRQWEGYTYQACAEWCVAGDNKEAAVRVLEAGVKEYPKDLNLRLQLMDLCRKLEEYARAYPHLPMITEGRKDDPAVMIVSGDIAMRTGDYQMALNCFDHVMTLDNPDLAERAKKAAENVRNYLAVKSEMSEEDTGAEGTSNTESGEEEPMGRQEDPQN